MARRRNATSPVRANDQRLSKNLHQTSSPTFKKKSYDRIGQSRDELVDGFVRQVVEGTVSGPMRQDCQVVMIFLLQTLGPEREAGVGVARGIQWWEQN